MGVPLPGDGDGLCRGDASCSDLGEGGGICGEGDLFAAAWGSLWIESGLKASQGAASGSPGNQNKQIIHKLQPCTWKKFHFVTDQKKYKW